MIDKSELSVSVDPKSFPENRFPSCLFFKLESSIIDKKQSDVLVTISFNEQKLDFTLGSILFGLNGGELCFSIVNGLIPYELRSCAGSMDISLETQRTVDKEGVQKTSCKDSNEGNIGVKGFYGNAYIKDGQTKVKSQENKKIIHDQFKFKKWQITTKGTETEPIWCFKCETEDEIFRTSLVKERLGTLLILKIPCFAAAEFRISRKNLKITYAENFFSKNITNNKKSVIKMLLERKLIKMIGPYLSKDIIAHD